MCGINLIYDIKGALPNDEPLQRMQAAIGHRGPDKQGTERITWQEGQLWLGNTRLRILDTRHIADQPWHYPRQAPHSWLSYNGELYNYTDLRNDLLQLGYEFSSGSDTEVVLYALEAWGTEALDKFVGMFALVYSNSQRNELIIARDRHGMKPLYWSKSDNYILVSSEIKGILASNIVKPEIDKRQITHYLQQKFAQAPSTFFRGIYTLPPGHFLLIYNSASETIPFTRKASSNYPAKFSVETLEEVLVDALYRHVQAHRPLGLFLSGGADSTLLLALMRKHLASHMPVCFTAANTFGEANWGTQDFKWAAKVAQAYQANHEVLELNAEEVLTRFSAIAQSQDQPIADGAYWLTYLLSENAASQNVPVVFSGAGADEYFAGYYRLQAFQYYLQHKGKLNKLLPIYKNLAGLLPTGLNWPGRAKAQQLQKFLSRISPNSATTWQHFANLDILSIDKNIDKQNFSLEEAYQHDIDNFLVKDVLAVTDNASMQHGVEIRLPFLDDELVNWLNGFEPAEILGKGRKWMLNELLMQQPLGKEVAKRRKEGFGLPFGAWVNAGKADFLFDWIKNENELHTLLPASRVKEMLNLHKKGKADFSQELLAVAGLTEWLKSQL